ncbi:MAG: chromosome segregation protein SMC [Acidobacteria bacterium]|nr:chromosome segregation protein SMC [Acidobacteriota bacterium]MBI3658002.1 chromosome segregation protein SMC [Acidobacteriota bacterium]
MHRIDRLEIYGFKSFCEKTDIVLNGEVTAIVGPNGCGKSNVADAINWVLGEQSTKTLRAGRMEDVIFNGTQKRKALGVAEVTLTLREFANGASLPADFPSENGEVTVSRRLYRSGESEYFLNQRRCRLKDVYEFFEGTGLGSTSYALIEQGRIEVILGSKPQDRRALIEEAARISIFKTKRKSAELKLELARQNLSRVSDIIQEVDRQTASLKRQAAKTRRYYRLRDELKFFSRINYWHRSRSLTNEIRTIHDRLQQQRQEEQTLTERLNAELETRRRLAEEVEQLESEVAQLREEFSGLRVEEERAGQQLAYQENRQQALRDRSVEIAETLAEYGVRKASARHESDAATAQLETLSSEIALGEAAAQGLAERLQRLVNQLDDAEAELSALRSSTLGEVEQLAGLRQWQENAAERIETAASQLTRLDEECANLAVEQARHVEKREMLEKALSAGTAALAALRTTLADEEARAAQLQRVMAGYETELQHCTQEMQSLQHRLASLDEIEKRRAIYSEGVQRFLGENSSVSQLNISGTLADFVETAPHLEAAVEGFMDAHLQHVVVATLEDAVRSLQQVRERETGRCSFLILEPLHDETAAVEPPPAIPDSYAASVVGSLRNLLSITPAVDPAFTRAFPDLGRVIVVADLPTALALVRPNPSYIFLTRQGEVVSGRGLVSALGERKEEIGFLRLKRERKELALQIERCRQERQTKANQVSQSAEDLRASGARRQELAEQSHRLEVERSALAPQFEQAVLELRRLAAQATELGVERQRVEEARAKLRSETETVAAAILTMEGAGRRRAERLLELEETLPPQKLERNELTHGLGDLRLTLAKKAERRRGSENDLHRLTSQISDHAAQTEKLEREQAQAQATLENLRQSNEELRLKMAAMVSRRLYLEEALQSEHARMAALKEQAKRLEDVITSLHAQRQTLTETRTQMEVEYARHTTERQHLAVSCQEEFHEDLESLAANMNDEQLAYDPQEAERNYIEVKEKVETYGAINMTALEEFQQLEERHNFLLAQQADIQSAIEATQAALTEINRRSTEQFKETFDAINQNFKELFTLLFGGGQCEMRLLDETDLLESGIEIIAQPPGKRLQNVMLLSGGEKALVALALLLGIFKFRPSPFCLLDEVDAPLDDANVSRFTRLLGVMGKNTQFILITHNKKTMEVAQYLYGVTMQEAGVSKIVSVKFE